MNAFGLHAATLERLEHGRVVGWLVDVGVLALDVEHDRRDPRVLEAMYRSGDRSRLATSRRTNDAGMPWQHRFVLRADARFHVVVANHLAQGQVAADTENSSTLVFRQDEDGTLG